MWFLILLSIVFALIPDIIIKVAEDMQLSKLMRPPQKLSHYIKRSKRKSNQVELDNKNTYNADNSSNASKVSMAKKVLNVKLFQSDKSVLSSNNIELINQQYETSTF